MGYHRSTFSLYIKGWLRDELGFSLNTESCSDQIIFCSFHKVKLLVSMHKYKIEVFLCKWLFSLFISVNCLWGLTEHYIWELTVNLGKGPYQSYTPLSIAFLPLSTQPHTSDSGNSLASCVSSEMNLEF